MTTPHDDALLRHEFDQFQRYGFLRRLLVEAYGEPRAEPVRVLDVGSGPEQLTSTFLGKGFDVVRCDVESFGRDDIVVLDRDAPYPFASDAFDVVIALEVLEHVSSEEREHLLDEALRVARELVVISAPDGRPDVIAAEARIADAFELLTGERHPFLSEHSDFGLPTENEVRGLLDSHGVRYLVAGTSPLDRWEAFLTLDQVLRTVYEGPQLAEELNRRANAESDLRLLAAGFYRNFFVVRKSGGAFTRVERMVVESGVAPLSDLRVPVFQLARLVAPALSDARAQLQQAQQGSGEAGERAAVLQTELDQAQEHARELEQAVAASEQRSVDLERALRAERQRMRHAERPAGEAEQLIARMEQQLRGAHELEQETEHLRSALARIFFELDRPTPSRLVDVLKRVMSPSWENVPFGATPAGDMTNVLSGGHSMWFALRPRAALTLRIDLPAGAYQFRARVVAVGDATLRASFDGETRDLVRLEPRLRDLAVDVTADKPATEVVLELDGPFAVAGLGDLHMVRRVDESRLTSVARNAVAIARGRKELRWLGRTRPAQPMVRRLRATSTRVTQPEPSSYETWIASRLETRKRIYGPPRSELPLSILTTVWNTPVPYFERLADSIFAQDYDAFEWVLLDNGSTAPETIAAVARLAEDSRTTFERVDENLGIIGGMRHCLERARGEYVLPVDSDDYVYPDAFRIVCNALLDSDYPALVYSDEDKLSEDRFVDPYLKSDWDPVLFLNSCYIAHLCAIDRQRAIDLGAYTDEAAEGCHDWDTFLRFMLAGHEPLHIPEVLYSWRMHPQSAALNIGSKPYLDASHTHVLRKFIAAQPHPERYRVVRSPLWGPTPDWYFERDRVAPRPIMTVHLASTAGVDDRVDPMRLDVTAESAMLRPAIDAACAGGALLQLVWDEIETGGADDWQWEVLALMELHPETAIVGGRVHDSDDRIVAAGEYLGFGGVCGCPDVGRSLRDPGYFGQMWKQRTVSAVSTMFMICDPSFVREALDHIPPEVSVAFLGAWLGAHAARTGRRVVCTPFLTARCRSSRSVWEAVIRDEERRAFVRANDDVVPDTRYLSPLLSLNPTSPYTPTSLSERAEVLGRWLSEAARQHTAARVARG